MNIKKMMKFIGIVLFIEIIMLILMGGFGSNSHNDQKLLFSLGPVNFYKYGMALDVNEDMDTVNLDGTPVEHETFLAVNLHTMKMLFMVDFIILLGAFLVSRSIRNVPGRLQGTFELLFDLFRELVRETLGKHGDRHFPTIVTLFLFIWVSNLLGVIPLLSEPTRDVNVPIGQMLVMIAIVHFEAIRVKGIKKYTKEYFEPFFIMVPLNVIGEIAKGISLSFRLFGNISGGSIIILVISYLFKYTIMPVGLNLFFGIFVGTVQAFVFTMLSLTYIAVAVAE
jgi:F-type H+-transporting ATPase subunit a